MGWTQTLNSGDMRKFGIGFPAECVSRFLAKSVFRFGAVFHFDGLRVVVAAARFSMDCGPGAASDDPQTAGTDALLGVGCCLENMRWPDLLERRTCRVVAA